MRIALVATGGLHPSGREEVIPALLWLVERLARAHDVHAFALRHLPSPTQYVLRGATIHDLGRPIGTLAQRSALLAALRRSGPFDLIHAYWVDPSGLVASLAGRTVRTPVLVSCDSGEFTSLRPIGYGLQRSLRGRAAVALACRFASAVHVTSEYMQGLALQHRVRATCIPLGVDVGAIPFRPRPEGGPPWRLLQVAGLNAVKDQSTALRALTILRQSTDVELDLVGEDSLGGQVQREADTLGLRDAVRFHGFQPHDALPPLRDAAHLYVQSSRHEAAGVSVLEAAAAGLPIVGTRVGFVSDWAGKAALAVPPGDPQALAAAIGQLLNDRVRRETLAIAARSWVEQHDADATARAMANLYQSLIDARPGRAG